MREEILTIPLNKDLSKIANSKVMIVDDNPLNVELLEEVLEDFNFKIFSFTKPKEALKLAMTEHLDLILVDIMMPEMSGFDLIEQIKASEFNKNVSIIFISALSDVKTKAQSYNLGSCAYIEKPFDLSLVKIQICNLLKNKKQNEEQLDLKENFMATVAHDMKTPLNAGINALKMLLENYFGELDNDQEEIVNDIMNSAQFMRHLLDNLLFKSKIDKDSLHIKKEVYDLKEVVLYCIDITNYILSEKHQNIIFECDCETRIPMDCIDIKRCIHNLIANASDYSPKNSQIKINICDDEQFIYFSIQDFGEGIEKSRQETLFTQYLSYAKEYKKIGCGLGLYITKNIVEAHGGTISIDSELGYGTTIKFSLPKV